MKKIVIFLLALVVWGVAVWRWVPYLKTIIEYSYWQGFISDYRFFYYAFENVWNQFDHHLLYDCVYLREKLAPILPDLPEHGCYLYPPQFAVLLSWLAAFPYERSDQIFNLLSFSMFVIGIIFLLSFVMKKGSWEVTFLLLGLGMLAAPAFTDTFYNNSNRFLFFFICLSFYFGYVRKNEWFAGIPLGLAIVFKITPVMIFVFLLIKGRFPYVISTIITMVISTFISLFVIGWDVHWQFITKDFWQLSGNLTDKFVAPVDSSIQGIVGLYFPEVDAENIFYGYVIVVFLLLAYLLRKSKDEIQEVMLLALTPLLFSPHLEGHHMILLVIPLTLWFGNAFTEKYIGWKYLLFIPALLILTINPKTSEYFLMLLFVFILATFPIKEKT